MSTKYKFHNPDGLYFVTLTLVEWVDVFTRDVYREIIIESLTHCQKEKGLVVHAYVIMTNHIHLIISRKGKMSLGSILRDFKKYTSFQLYHSIKNNDQESRRKWIIEIFNHHGKINPSNTNFQVWQNESHPIELTSNQIIDQKLDYIHNNPVKQGFVHQSIDYPWSSMGDYFGNRGCLEIELIQ